MYEDRRIPVPSEAPGKDEQLKFSIRPIKDLPFDKFEIPEYQRPYKWNSKYVLQLITDLVESQNKEEYRLGTLVLHENEIVDGQQRIVTLALILFEGRNWAQTKNPNFYNKINNFLEATRFSNPHSIGHVHENIRAIKERRQDLNERFFDFLLHKCKFLVIELKDLSEAFQFFDSQNARGKGLSPHDLLKAFHLREIPKFTDNDKTQLKRWEEEDPANLINLFLCLYRIKKWIKGESAREFTKKDLDTFIGISLNNLKYPHCLPHLLLDHFINSCKFCGELSAYPTEKNANEKSKSEFPFQLEQRCLNGSRFFEMILHYLRLWKDIRKPETSKLGSYASSIVDYLNTYPQASRTGDQYVRQLFDCLLLFYVDKFGLNDIGIAVRKIFLWTYGIRLESGAVFKATIDNEAKKSPLLKAIQNAITHQEVINRQFPRENLKLSSEREQEKPNSGVPKLMTFYINIKNGSFKQE